MNDWQKTLKEEREKKENKGKTASEISKLASEKYKKKK